MARPANMKPWEGGPGPVAEGEEFPIIERDEPLREEDVTLGDKLDDRVREEDALPPESEAEGS